LEIAKRSENSLALWPNSAPTPIRLCPHIDAALAEEERYRIAERTRCAAWHVNRHLAANGLKVSPVPLRRCGKQSSSTRHRVLHWDYRRRLAATPAGPSWVPREADEVVPEWTSGGVPSHTDANEQ
jgi:hypothetical protein